jgi:predicted helicase
LCQLSYSKIVWHSSLIPEEELYLAGIVNDFNKLRIERIASKKYNGKVIYRDYGIDFLTKDQNGIYHAGQCKFYKDKVVTASDIGTFLAVLIGQVKTTGYLYTTSPLQSTLNDIILNSDDRIYHKQLEYIEDERKEKKEFSNL